MVLKFEMEVNDEFVTAVNNKWLQVQGVRFSFSPNGTMGVELTPNYHNARVVEQFLEPNNGKAVVYQGTLPV